MNQMLVNRYKIIRELGDGGFGKTYVAEDTHMPSNRYSVIKQLKPMNVQNCWSSNRARFIATRS
ncbi:MAG: hypothetical protein MJK14_22830 [Rivularia sp. ALOHA_DT_140]|nr:hypothetical protein [Rivularia sp. ALOHA_DT_140]